MGGVEVVILGAAEAFCEASRTVNRKLKWSTRLKGQIHWHWGEISDARPQQRREMRMQELDGVDEAVLMKLF